MTTSRDELQQQLSQSYPEQEQSFGMQSESITIPEEITLEDYLAITNQMSILRGESDSERKQTLMRGEYYVKEGGCSEPVKSCLIEEYNKNVKVIIAFLNRDITLIKQFPPPVIAALNKSNVYYEFIAHKMQQSAESSHPEQGHAFLPQYAALAPQAQVTEEPIAAPELQPNISNFTRPNPANTL